MEFLEHKLIMDLGVNNGLIREISSAEEKGGNTDITCCVNSSLIF
jgi:hypothetical protein